jgi:YVTN family beta-propeller protein
MRYTLILLALPLFAQPTPTLDYPFFRDQVEPILLNKRPGHARCVACHEHGSPPLQPLAAGATAWTEAESRKNFDIWKLFVKPGNPTASPLLLHALAAKAGGDHFHAGGKHWQSQSDPEWQTLARWVNGEKLNGAKSEPTLQPRVLQTNAAGDNTHIIDPATNKVVGIIEGIEVPHGIALAPDGRTIYITDEPRASLDVIDALTLKLTRRIPLTGRPNNLAVSHDGKTVYVGIVDAPGSVDIIDTASASYIKSVKVQGGVHNVYITPDGKFAVAGSIPGKIINVIDTATNTLAWTLPAEAGIRPMAFTTNPDGSTKNIIVQHSDYHGLVVVDFAARKEIRRVPLPDPPGMEKETQGIQGSPSHGLAITPDGKTLWATSKWYGYVAAFSLPDLKLVKVVQVGSHPEWLTIPPDGKNLYIACAGDDTTVVIDNKTMEIVTKIPVGAVPKRNTSGMLLTR